MKIGILGVVGNSNKWGGYQYSLSVIRSLLNNNKFGHEYYIFQNSLEGMQHETTEKESIFLIQNESLFVRIFKKIAIMLNFKFPFGMYKEINKLKLDLLVIPKTAGLSGCYLKIPYITCVHDIMHKHYPSFPEYPAHVRIKRNFVYKKAAKNAILTVVDSEQGKEDLVKFYNIDRDRVEVIPFIPPPYVFEYRDTSVEKAEELILKFELPNRYIFYPAQFWFHKNHITLLKALCLIKEKYKERIPLVLVGTDKGYLNKVISCADDLRIKDQIYYLGYIADREVIALYKKAVALIFPSLFGPTNIPIVEAMVLGTPIVCSNLFAMPDQVDGAGILFNPFDEEDIAEKVHTIWRDSNLRKRLVEKGYKKSVNMTIENFASKWNEVIYKAEEIINVNPKRLFEK